MSPIVQVKATIPKRLKIRSKAALALTDQTFSSWLEEHLEAWLNQVEARLGIPLEAAMGQDEQDQPHEAAYAQTP